MGFSTSHTAISKGTRVQGRGYFSGDWQMEGKGQGKIQVEGGTDARLVGADKGMVEGEIRVPVVVINGKVVGNVYSSKHLELAAKAVVEGNVHYQLIEMVKGSQVNGNLVYGEPSHEAKASDEPAADKGAKGKLSLSSSS